MQQIIDLELNICNGFTHLCIKNTFDKVKLYSEEATSLIEEFNSWSDMSCENSSFLKTYFKNGNIEWFEFHKRARILHLKLGIILENEYELTMKKLVDLD